MIIFDSNEAMSARTQNLSWLLNGSDIETDSERLPSGDIYFFGRSQDGKFSRSIGCEVKVFPDDLVSSLGDGRLVQQLPRIVSDFTVPYLLLLRKSRLIVNWETGKIMRKADGEWVDTRFAYHYLNSLLLKFEMAGGSVRWFYDLAEMHGWLVSAYRYYREESHNTRTWIRKKPVKTEWQLIQNPMVDFYERIVSKGGRSIGIDRAIALAEYFASPLDIAKQTTTVGMIADIDLATGKKFGKAQAERVKSWFSLGEVV